MKLETQWLGNSLVVQWLGAFTAKGPGSISGQGTKIPQAAWHGQNTITTTNNNKNPHSMDRLKADQTHQKKRINELEDRSEEII